MGSPRDKGCFGLPRVEEEGPEASIAVPGVANVVRGGADGGRRHP
jgi:hypothetical protein